VPVDLLMLQAMVRRRAGRACCRASCRASRGETGGQYRHEQARREQDERDGRAAHDMIALYLHDVPPDLAVEILKTEWAQSATPMEKLWPLEAGARHADKVLAEARHLPVPRPRPAGIDASAPVHAIAARAMAQHAPRWRRSGNTFDPGGSPRHRRANVEQSYGGDVQS
jgi:hypothetical protein